MASAESASKKHDIPSQFEKIREKIRDKFSRIHYLLQERESTLLEEVKILEDRFREKGKAKEIKQLSLSIKQVEDTLEINKSKKSLQYSYVQMNHKITELKVLLEKAKGLESIDLEWSEDLEDKLNVLGAIRVNSEKKSSKLNADDYTKKGTPLAVFGQHKLASEDPGVFAYPTGLAIDTRTENIYISDGANERVQVFNKSFQFLFIFSEKMIGPNGISFHQEKVYVTQSRGHYLNIYSRECKLLKTVGKEGTGELEFGDPRGIAISEEWRRIYICEYDNDRIQSLNLDLTFDCFIPDIFGARDVKLSAEEIVVLCQENPCIRIYNSSHQLSRQLISRGEDSTNQVRLPLHLFLDSEFNILLTDNELHCVFIFSYTGELIHKFGGEGEEKGNFIEPEGITIDSAGRIIVVSYNPNNCVQVF